ncbi:hypothetical protein OO013_12610 [Mangrovivirga sp. M17]|uniref:Outer membrane protein beta-barrel domain-containing protein n=1 Tax=Mangrovivirga halotolerans TaxID=2993936 RepID=A0ABT3RSF3_9BACT|nr:hypothetical protein [Mangrovivirga halotolerans]MCX2744716.1 hypothetical protein [Mangrovivirga halotolerans]
MRFSLLIILSIFLSSSNINGQDKDKKLSFSIEAGHLSGIGKIHHTEDIYYENFTKASRLRFILDYKLNGYFSTGLGFGLEGYQSNLPVGASYYNTAPLFLEFSGKLKDSGNTPVASFRLGNSMKLAEIFESGLHLGVDLGYLIKLKKISLRPSVGYNLQQIRNTSISIYDENSNNVTSYESNILLKSLSFNLRLTL